MRTYVSELQETKKREEQPWHESVEAWRFVVSRFVPLLAAGHLIWETLQLPYYALWREGTPRAQVFAVLHCTEGDVMIGTASLLLALVLFGRRGWPCSPHGSVVCATLFFGVAYTVFSEWMNTQITMQWQYAQAMPRVSPLEIGLAPLLQWIVIPPVAYSVAWALRRRQQGMPQFDIYE